MLHVFSGPGEGGCVSSDCERVLTDLSLDTGTQFLCLKNLPWSWCFPVWSEPRNSPLAVRSLCRGKKTKTRKGNSNGEEISETFKRERSQDVLCVTKCQRCHLKWTKGTVSLWNLLLLDLINFYCEKLWKHQQFVHFFASYKMTNSSGVL